MKDVPIPTEELEELRAALSESGLIKREAAIGLLPYQPAFARRSEHRHVHYLVNSGQQPVCHLVSGKNLDRLDAHAKAFAAACPKLACRPLFYKAGRRTDYLGLEHFSGESLDAAVQSGRYSGTDWLKAVRHAQGLLERTEQQSDPARLHEEVTELVNNACAFPGFSDVDARLLRDLVQPVLMDTAANVPLVTHWSTGDFVGRNLLVNAVGDIRLIDYDHAGRTHFGRSDWLRLMQFSNLPPGLDLNSVKELNFADRPRHEVYLWLHQLALLREAEHTEITKRHIALIIHQLFAAIDRAIGRKASCLPHSFLLSSLVEQQIETESSLQEHTAWAQSLECDLKKARAALTVQTELVEERTAWAKSLDQELGSARQSLEKLTAEHAERTAWAQSLDADLQKARASHLKQVQAAAELIAELATVDKACKALAAFIPGDPEWDRAALVERSLQILVDLRREVSAKNAATNAAAAATLRTQLASEIAESDARRLAAALADAQLHVDGLLQHAARLQDSLNRVQATNQETEKALRGKEHLLSSSIAELQATREELSRYESRLICRLAARPSSLLLARKFRS